FVVYIFNIKLKVVINQTYNIGVVGNKNNHVHLTKMAKVDLSRISLRPFKLTDVDDFFLWAGDNEVTKNIRWKTCLSREEALVFIKDVCIPHPWRRSICLNDRSIGFVSVYRWLGDDRLQAFADVDNKASQRVLEKAGFLREGVLRQYTIIKGTVKDLAVFSFLSTDEIPHVD
ncbi:hypothetical protein KIW84_030414, partial [Lathyrus oleraceus]